MSFWENVDEELKFKGLTRTYLAQKAGFSLTNIGKGIQLGSTPSADTAVKIAKVLGVTVEYLVTGEVAEAVPMCLDLKKIHRYANLIEELDSLPEQQRKLLRMIVAEMGAWGKSGEVSTKHFV